MHLDNCETATILAALRLLQAQPALPAAIEAIATDYGRVEPLDDTEIDQLCERINLDQEDAAAPENPPCPCCDPGVAGDPLFGQPEH